ncbi:MAG: disulfide bond formation protein B [Legionellales bacterium]|nr:disulfide bond formation protein B [Legionellales bacterium]
MKKWQVFLNKFELIDTMIGIVAVFIILNAALFMQLYYHEAPCPLCLLQRAAFINIGLALLMNVRYRNRVLHWAMVIVSAVVGAAVSLRQILLHINDPTGFGDPVLGLHLYTWSFIGFSIAMVGATLMLVIYPENQIHEC